MSAESEDIEQVVKAIRTVPPKSLLLIELANSIPVVNGVFDYQALANKKPEIELAIVEAKTYGSYTLVTVEALAGLKGVAG